MSEQPKSNSTEVPWGQRWKTAKDQLEEITRRFQEDITPHKNTVAAAKARAAEIVHKGVEISGYPAFHDMHYGYLLQGGLVVLEYSRYREDDGEYESVCRELTFPVRWLDMPEWGPQGWRAELQAAVDQTRQRKAARAAAQKEQQELVLRQQQEAEAARLARRAARAAAEKQTQLEVAALRLEVERLNAELASVRGNVAPEQK